MRKIFTILILSVFIFSACSYFDNPIIKEQEVSNVESTLISLDWTKWDFDNFDATLDFEEGRYVLNAWCNTVSGSYDLLSENIFMPWMSTQMFCWDEIMSVEAKLSKFLTEVKSFEYPKNTIFLDNWTEKISISPAKKLSLENNEWKLSSILVNNGLVSSVSFKDSSILFSDDGTVSWVLICNNFTWKYEKNNDLIKITSLWSTRKMCQNQWSPSEIEISNELLKVTNFKIDRNTLTFYSSDNSVKIQYTK